MATTKDGAIEIAVNNGYVFTNTLSDDLLIRTTDSNQSIHFGTGSNTQSAMYISSNNALYVSSNLYIKNALCVNTSNTFSSINVGGSLNLQGNIYKNNNLFISDIQSFTELFKVSLPIKQRFQVGANTSNFNIQVNGDFTANVTDMDVFLNGTKLAYLAGNSNDYSLNVLRSGSNTNFNVSLAANAITNDIVDITIWPSTSNFFVTYSGEWATEGSNIFNTNVNGNVGIGLSNPSYKLHIGGDVYATGDVLAYSDSNVKTDLIKITNAVPKILELNGYTYTRKTHVENPPRRYAGLLAQDVEKVLPEVIHRDAESNMSIAYGNMASLFVEAFKEIKNEIITMRQDIDDIKKMVYANQ